MAKKRAVIQKERMRMPAESRESAEKIPFFKKADHAKVTAKSKESARELQAYVKIMENVNRGLRAFISEMTIVFRFIETVSMVHSLDRILELLMDVLRELCGYDAAALYLSTEEGGKQELKLSVQPEWIEKFRKKLEIDERIYSWVYRQGHAVIIPERFNGKKRKCSREWSFMIAPLATPTDRLGRIEMFFRRPQGAFTQQTFSILNVLLKHAMVIIANERVYEKERKTAQKYIELDLLKKDVVNTTTHEIRTPLTIIQAASILLEQKSRMPNTERKELYQKITQQCERINQIVGELFETSKLEDGQMPFQFGPVSLPALTDEVIKNLYYDPAKIQFKITCDNDSCEVRADRSSLYQILRNLMENAVKYSPDGGIIEITVKNKAPIIFWQIKDQGVGIPPEDLEKIFDKFYRAGASTTRRFRGLGLGLYIVKKNVEINGGKISVQSALGSGSTFSLELPKI